MSAVFLHVGQCGNQLGQAFWQEVEEWAIRSSKKATVATPHNKDTPNSSGGSSSHRLSASKQSLIADKNLPYCLQDGTLPCVLVDTEPKVVRRCTTAGAGVLSRRVPKEFLVTDRAGCGNNWAYGYCGKNKVATSRYERGATSHDWTMECGGSRVEESVRNHVRKVVEKCDRFGGVVMFHSIAGGTGAGLSSVLLKDLRDDYPLGYIISVPVAPFKFGESPLQHYNSLLCLSWIQTYSDAAILFQNDSVLEQAQKNLMESQPARKSSLTDSSTGSVSLEDMNRHISSTLANSFLPVWNAKQKSSSMSGQEPWELVRSLCPDPALKFITPVHTLSTRSSHSWDQVISRLTSSTAFQRHNSLRESKASTSSVVLISRANSAKMELFVHRIQSLEKKLKFTFNTVNWNPYPIDYWTSYEEHLGDKKFSTVLANSSSVLSYFDCVCERAKVMFEAKAYLHWYQRYGCEEDTFKEAFEVLQNIVDNYASF